MNGMTTAKVIARLRRLAEDWRREEKRLCEQFGDVILPQSMRARQIKDTQAIDAAGEMIERMEKMQAALRRHHEMAMGAGLDPSHSLTKLRVSAYQQTCLYADTMSALEEPK